MQQRGRGTKEDVRPSSGVRTSLPQCLHSPLGPHFPLGRWVVLRSDPRLVAHPPQAKVSIMACELPQSSHKFWQIECPHRASWHEPGEGIFTLPLFVAAQKTIDAHRHIAHNAYINKARTMSNKSIRIKPIPYYGKAGHSLAYKLALGTAALLIWAAVIVGGVVVN